MKHALIFGVSGQDGSHLSELLLEKGYCVYGVCRRSSVDNTGRIKHLVGKPNFEILNGDITDSYSVYNIMKDIPQIDEVYNLAAQSHVGLSFSQPAVTWDITGKGCLNILQSIVDLNISPRFYQASSSEMFGKSYDIKDELKLHNEMGLVSHETRMNGVKKYQSENTRFLPQSPYAIAKCAAHYMTRLFREAYGLHASAGILFNHEGPRRGENFVTRKITKWIGEFVTWRKKNSEYPLEFTGDYICTSDYGFSKSTGPLIATTKQEAFPKLRLGNLDASRDWGYAGDFVEAMWMMLQQDDPDDYVICTGETHTIREFLDVAFKHVGIEDWERHVVIDPEFYRPAEVDYLRGDSSKAKKHLGWKPKVNFEGLVKIMVDHDCENL